MVAGAKVNNGTGLRVPFNEKDQVKQLGAKWDPTIKQWYVPQGVDVSPFTKWLETAPSSSGYQKPSAPKQARSPSFKNNADHEDFDAINSMLREAAEVREHF